jgi:hypothetical protein
MPWSGGFRFTISHSEFMAATEHLVCPESRDSGPDKSLG